MRPEPITLAFNLQEAKRFLRLLGNANIGNINPFIRGIEDALRAQIAEREAVPVAPWRKVVGKDKGSMLLGSRRNRYDLLECGHRYRLRSSKNWMEDHGTRRRCQECLREEKK
jgi:hypothetical protein